MSKARYYRMISVRVLSICTLFLMTSVCFAAAEPPRPSVYSVAMLTFGVADNTATDSRLDVAVWFPAKVDPAPIKIDRWKLPVGISTKVFPGFYPIILLSHDVVSDRFANNDLALALASRGNIVVAPTHKGDSQDDSSFIFTAKNFFERPRQLLKSLEVVLASPELAPYADESRIGLIGVGFGSTTVLQLAGGIPVAEKYMSMCNDSTMSSDMFCRSYVRSRLKHIDTEFAALTKQFGKHAFSPKLSLFAPQLKAVEIPQESEQATEAKKDKKILPLLQRKDKEVVEVGEQAQLRAEGETSEKQSDDAQLVERLFLNIDFQLTTFYGAGDNTESPLIQLGPVVANFEVAVSEDLTPQVMTPVEQKAKAVARVYRRPESLRQIRAVAMLTPGGAMFFSAESLVNVTVPVAIIEAEKDDLYSPEIHSHPYARSLPRRPKFMQVKNSDHFSLFAPCSYDQMIVLGESCGKAIGQERESLASYRDSFLQSFFGSILGGASEVPVPSGFIAVPPDENAVTTAGNSTRLRQ